MPGAVEMASRSARSLTDRAPRQGPSIGAQTRMGTKWGQADRYMSAPKLKATKGTEVRRLGRRNRPAVDDVFRAGDRCGLGRDEEGNEVRYFPWLRRAPD